MQTVRWSGDLETRASAWCWMPRPEQCWFSATGMLIPRPHQSEATGDPGGECRRTPRLPAWLDARTFVEVTLQLALEWQPEEQK